MTGQYILVVDDEPAIRDLVQEILEDEAYEVDVAESAAEARDKRSQRRPDLVLLDIWMPGEDGISLLKDWQESGSLACPVIMMSGHGTVETAVQATRLGAYDFIEKPLTLAKLLLCVRRALEADQLRKENVGLKHQTSVVREPIGSSEIMQQLREQAKRLAEHDTWLLITGEPGAGKQTTARYIHSLSARREQAFVNLGAASLASDNVSAELFGRETGEQTNQGLLDQANGGVLFMDEVADLDLQVQGLLVNAFEASNYMHVGGVQVQDLDVRVIAATCRDLQEDVKAERFREDLFYRLNVVPLHVPPLREHTEDIPELLNYYVDYYCSREGFTYRHFSISAQNRLKHYSWPGNIRELRNLVQRLLILGIGDEIDSEEVNAALGDPSVRPDEQSQWQHSVFELPLREAREAFERNYLLHQLKNAQGSVTKLSQRVGMERTHLYRKLRALGINPKEV